MMFVLDCSVTMAWCFEDEADKYAEQVLEFMKTMPAIVPELWHLEVMNVLLIGERTKRLKSSQVDLFLKLLSELTIQIDLNAGSRAFSSILNVARSHKLTSYDSVYLELAIRENIPLATLNNELRRAAKKAGVKLLDKTIE